MKTSAKEKIIKIFTGFNPVGDNDYERSFEFQNISTGNYDPPAYIVRIILIELLGLPDYGPMEKVWWHTVFNYKNKTFLIRDYKFGSWSIEGETADELAQKIVSEIKKKIKIASNNLDKILYAHLKYYAQNGNFFIKNLSRSLSSIYYFYLQKTKDAIDDVRNLKTSKVSKESNSLIADSWNENLKLTKTTFCYVYSMIHAFYSYLEFILDVIYAFEQPNIDFWEFRKKCWNDRFKMLFNLKIRALNKIYVKLLEYKNKYRNPLSHGLTNEISILVPLPASGLVPLSYQFLSNELYYGLMGMNDINIAEQIIETFSSFLDYMNKSEPYSYYLRYAEWGFEIPVNKKDVEKIKNRMTNMEDFEEYLKGEAAYTDTIINREI